MSRYDLTDFEWRAIEPLLPNKPRGVPRVDDRRVLNGIFWVLRSGAPWRDLPERYGPRTTCYNRFVRWRKAGVWDRLMDAITKAHDGTVQMIDTSIVRVHQQGATGKKGDRDHCLGRSRGRLTTKIHALVDAQGRPIKLTLTAGQMSDIASAADLIKELPEGAMLLADKGYDANALRNAVTERKAWANIPPKANRKDAICFSPFLYKARNLVERFFNKAKQFRRIATRYDKLAENYLAALKLVAIRVWLRGNESTS
ncbi:IS5 family transposase [Mesorhizobium sp. SEMIA 3007]|uniref:IS5 family transposase n=1 Tax=Mesorhizobium sp. SEMIA 3007 TaxID=1862350 RepID=UPI00114CFAD3|nr:IS5 family transposase [Mesorhizobium sp. SEMIA 3007]